MNSFLDSAQSGLGQTGELLHSVCPSYSSGLQSIDTKEVDAHASLMAKYAGTDGVFRSATEAEALSRFDDLTRSSERARDHEWDRNGRKCVEDLASLFCNLPSDAFTPEMKQVLELAVRSYNAVSKSGTVRLADAHDIFVRKLNECVFKKRGISEITFRLMELVTSEMRDAMHSDVQKCRWTNLRVVGAAILALLIGVAMGYMMSQR